MHDVRVVMHDVRVVMHDVRVVMHDVRVVMCGVLAVTLGALAVTLVGELVIVGVTCGDAVVNPDGVLVSGEQARSVGAGW